MYSFEGVIAGYFQRENCFNARKTCKLWFEMNVKNKQTNSAKVHHVFCRVYKPYYKRLLLYSELWMSSSCIIARLIFSGKKNEVQYVLFPWFLFLSPIISLTGLQYWVTRITWCDLFLPGLLEYFCRGLCPPWCELLTVCLILVSHETIKKIIFCLHDVILPLVRTKPKYNILYSTLMVT